MFCFCCGWILSASAHYRNLSSRARLFKTLDTRQSKIHQLSMHLIYTKTIIETSREHFSISTFGRKQQASFDNVLNSRTCATHGHNFSKTTYPAVRNSSRFSTKTSIWTFRNLGVEMPSDFRTPGLDNCLGKVVQITTKRLSVCWRKSAICNNSVAWQRLHMVLGFAPKGT